MRRFNGLVVALSVLAALATLLTGVVGEAMAVNWKINNQPLAANATQRVDLSAPNNVKLVFTTGTEEYKIECLSSTGTANLIGGNPGKDGVLTLSASSCSVTRKIGGTTDFPCKVSSVSKVGTNWGSVLSEVAPNFFDTFESLELQFRIVNEGTATCPIAGNITIEGSNFKGKYENAFQRWKYESATNPKFAGVNATLTWEYAFALRDATIQVALNGGAPQWEVGKGFLEAKEVAGVQNEAKLVEIVDKALGLTLACKKVSGSGLIEGASSKSPGTGLDVIELGSCEVAGAKACKVTEPVVLSTKTKLTSLEKEEFGLELSAKEGTTIGSITLSNASEKEACTQKGTYKLTGDTVGKVNNTTEELEFTSPAHKGSALKLAESEAILVGKIKNTEGGTVAAG